MILQAARSRIEHDAVIVGQGAAQDVSDVIKPQSQS